MDSETSVMTAILAFMASFALIIIAIAILWYVLNAFGFYKLAKNRNIGHAWIAWIPICQYYLLGELIGNRVWKIKYANWILVISQLVSSYITSYYYSLTAASPGYDMWSIITLIVVIVTYCYLQTAFYDLYKIYSDKPVLFLVLGIIFPFLTPIFVFIIRNNQPKAVKVY